MSDLKVLQRQLKIKTGVAKRTYKEHNLYREEVAANKIKLDKLKADGTEEEWYIKNAIKLIEESNKMIDDAAERLAVAHDELRDLVDSAKGRPELTEDPELAKAQETLNEISV